MCKYSFNGIDYYSRNQVIWAEIFAHYDIDAEKTSYGFLVKHKEAFITEHSKEKLDDISRDNFKYDIAKTLLCNKRYFIVGGCFGEMKLIWRGDKAARDLFIFKDGDSYEFTRDKNKEGVISNSADYRFTVARIRNKYSDEIEYDTEDDLDNEHDIIRGAKNIKEAELGLFDEYCNKSEGNSAISVNALNTPAQKEDSDQETEKKDRNSFCITMQPDFREKLGEIADRKGLSFSALVCLALHEYVEGEEIRRNRGYAEDVPHQVCDA